MDIDTYKAKLNEAFKRMRRAGLIARQRFSCCCNCAGSEIANDLEGFPKAKLAKVKGCVFYTKQDAESMFAEPRSRFGRKFDGLYLAYGQIGSEKLGDVGVSTVAVGQMVCEILEEVGLPFEWNGTERQRITVPFENGR